MIDVLILGAGIAGLATAHRLHAAGARLAVREARGRIGGRAFGLRLGDRTFDLGASWVWDHESAIHALIDELGLATFPSREQGDDLVEQISELQRGRMPTSWSAERRVVGGTQAIADALARRLPEGALQTGRRAESIRRGDDHLVVRFEGGEEVRASQVVAAFPPPLVAACLDDVDETTRERLRRTPVWMGDVAKVVAVYDEAFWRAEGLSGRAFSRRGPMVEVHDLSGPTDEEGVALFGFVPRGAPLPSGRSAEASSPEDLVEAVRAQLGRFFGDQATRPARLEIRAWWLERETVPTDRRPVDETLFGHAFLREPLIDGRLHLASTETAAQNAGHLDGAVRRAWEVAERLRR